MSKGLFVTFEGVDGCGKSTQMRFLSEYLDELGLPYIVTREPGGSPLAEKIREIILDVGNAEMTALTEAYLYAAARNQHIDEVILPALNRGVIVLCDRYIDSSVAYQGYGRRLGAAQVRAINAYAMGGCMPDVTFFFDFKPEMAFERMNPNKERDRLEQESDSFYRRVYDGFDEACRAEPQRIMRIDVSGTKFETKAKMRLVMDDVLKSWRERE